MHPRLSVCLRIGIAVAAAWCANAPAQSPAGNYPARPVTMVIPFPPSGSTDLEFRIYLPVMSKLLGSSVVMDYRGGAGTMLGTLYVSKAPPDGYTLLGTTISYATVPAAHPDDLPYDPINGLAALSQMTAKTSLVVVRAALPIYSIKDLVDYARANPGKLNHATSGNGGSPHLRAEQLYNMAGVKVNFIHYKGTAAMRLDLLGGRTDTAITLPTLIVTSIKDGTMRAIGSTGPGKMRDRMMPGIPTVAEQAYPDFGSLDWSGVFAPAGVPPAIVDILSNALMKVAKDPAVQKAMEPTGATMLGSTPAQFRDFVAAEINFTKGMVKKLGITPEL